MGEELDVKKKQSVANNKTVLFKTGGGIVRLDRRYRALAHRRRARRSLLLGQALLQLRARSRIDFIGAGRLVSKQPDPRQVDVALGYEFAHSTHSKPDPLEHRQRCK